MWPPTPGLSFAVLPYVRATYNEIYKYAFADLEKKWDMAVQRRPREGETAEQIAQAQDNRLAENGMIGGMLDIEVEVVEIEEREGNGAVPPPANPGPAARAGEEVAAEQAANQAPGQLGDNQAAAAPAANEQVWQFQRQIPTGTILRRSMEALFFPATASLVGDLLQLSLPSKWVTKPLGAASAKGLLQEKWGRSLVGGCLFVVLKDALTLYYKWKKAKNHEKRRIIDYVKEPKKTKV